MWWSVFSVDVHMMRDPSWHKDPLWCAKEYMRSVAHVLRARVRKERVLREELSKNVRLMSVAFALPNSGKDHMRRPCTKKDVSAQ